MSLVPIRVASSERYFVAEDQPFLFIGANDSVRSEGLAPLYGRRDVAAVEAYLSDMARNGITVLRLPLESAQGESRYFETSPGRFNPGMVRFWDDLLPLCERFGIRLLITPWDTLWMTHRWHFHAYNDTITKRGIVADRSDFFTNETVIRAMQNRLGFVIERWGGTGVVAAWDLFGAIDLSWGGNTEVQSAVIERLSRFVRTTERERYGFTRLQTLSVSATNTDTAYAESLARHPALDFVSPHILYDAPDFRKNTLQPVLALAESVQHALTQSSTHRPVVAVGEGTMALYNSRKKPQPEAADDAYERRLSWVHLASGGAGSGLRVPIRRPYILTPGMRRALCSLSDFAKFLDWRIFVPTVASIEVFGLDKVHTFGVQDRRQAVLFLMREPEEETARPIRIRMSGFAPAHYHIFIWNTLHGELTGEASVAVKEDTVLQTALYIPNGDTAFAIRPEPS